MAKVLYKSKQKVLSGVCGGFAEYMGQDPTLIRIIWLLIVVFTGFFPGIIAYIVAAFIMPHRR